MLCFHWLVIDFMKITAGHSSNYTLDYYFYSLCRLYQHIHNIKIRECIL